MLIACGERIVVTMVVPMVLISTAILMHNGAEVDHLVTLPVIHTEDHLQHLNLRSGRSLVILNLLEMLLVLLTFILILNTFSDLGHTQTLLLLMKLNINSLETQ
eukprot:c33249_g1_i1.p2 GENE.c33249_g1_i1~~c33249_g1_i1.p2  ORF type:complete len:104 (+),score=11.17 c33249_g1_i1:326-637(+)